MAECVTSIGVMYLLKEEEEEGEGINGKGWTDSDLKEILKNNFSQIAEPIHSNASSGTNMLSQPLARMLEEYVGTLQ